MTQANPEYSTKIVAPVYEITGYMHDSTLKMLDNFHQRVILSPRHAWEARESMVTRLWSQLETYLYLDEDPLARPGTTQALLILWPEAYPNLMDSEELVSVIGTKYVTNVRANGSSSDAPVRVFQLKWDKIDLSTRRAVVPWNEDRSWSIFAYKVLIPAGQARRRVWYEVTDHWTPKTAADKSKGPPAYLNQLIILTHPRSS